MSDLTPEELQQAIAAVRNRFPKNYYRYIDLIYTKLVVGKQQQVKRQFIQKEEKANHRKQQQSHFADKDSKDSFDFDELLSDDGRIAPPPFQRHQKVEQSFQPTPTRYEVFDDFNRMIQNGQLELSNDVYNRYGGKTRKLRPNLRRVDRNYEEEIQKNIQKAKSWQTLPNKEYRIYASKIAPRFHSRDEEVRYYEKRLAAKAFCERGYGLARVEEEYQINGGPVSMQKRRYKTVSTAFISDSYRRFQLFLNQDMKKSVRQISGPQMRTLYSVLLNATSYFQLVQYHCFRKCVKVAFDLGSVSIYQHEAVSLFLAVQMILKSRHPLSDSGKSQVGSEVTQVRNRSRPLNIYAPLEGGGYQEQQQQPNDLDLNEEDIDDLFEEQQTDFQDQYDVL